MNKYSPNFYDISDWQILEHLQTGGTRNKKIVKNPKNNEIYYFKTSLYREGRDYKYEFWSEIIASKIGQYLGFNVLDYNIAIFKNEIGCISKSMLTNNKTELIEGRQYLTGTNSHYNPESKESYKLYTFQFIEKALQEYNLKKEIYELIKTLVFDSIIGNSDRHQDNWSIIAINYNNIKLNERRKKINAKYSNFLTLLKLKYQLILRGIKANNVNNLITVIKGYYSPIYDSGCCFGREILDKNINTLDIEKYINKGTTEVRWENNDNKNSKISHFLLLQKIRNYKKDYKKTIDNEIKRVIQYINNDNLLQIIKNIDKNLDDKYSLHYLPQNRKDLICNILKLRINRLKQIYESNC